MGDATATGSGSTVQCNSTGFIIPGVKAVAAFGVFMYRCGVAVNKGEVAVVLYNTA